MKIKNKFDMLDAMSDINEEYVRKADRLLAQHRSGEAALKMEITPMKFSWKPIAAVAACLAVLVGVTFGIKAFMNKPVDVLTPAQQAYLNEWKDKLGGSVNVAYAVDRLNFIELDIPDDVVPVKFIDENRAVFIRDEKRGDEYVKTIEIYNFADKSCSVIAGGSGKINLIKQWNICYADNDYVIYHGESYQITGVYIPKAGLSLYNVKTGENTEIYTTEGILNWGETPKWEAPMWEGPMTVLDGKVYFTVYNNLGENSVHVYDIQQHKEIDVIANASSPQKYKGDILYGTEENGKFVTRSLSGKYSFDGGVWATEYGLYQFEAVGGRLTRLDTGTEIIPANSSDGLINLDDRCDFALQFGGMSLNSIEASQSALRFLFYAPTDEILVFQDGDGFGELNCFGWGATISKREPDGTFRTFIVTDKESEYAVKIPKLEPDSYLEETRYIFGAQGSVDYARNKLDIEEYDIPGFEGMPVLVDKNRAVVTGKDNAGFPKIGIYELGSGKETVLYSRTDDPEIDSETEIEVKYANKDYAVFEIKFCQGETVIKHELRMVGINSKKSYTVHTIYVNKSVHRIMVIVDGSLYFYDSDIVYRYKIGSEEKAVPVCQGGFNLMTYNGNVYYNEYEGFSPTPLEDAVRVYTRILDGEMPVDTEKYRGMLMVGETGIFHNDPQTITDCVNDKALLSLNTSGYLFAHLYDSLMMVVIEDNKTYQDRKVIYNTKTNELLVFAKGDELYYDLSDYREFDGGMYYALENDGVYSKLCVITEKDAKRDENAEKPYLEKMKDFFGAHGGVDYARNKLDIKEYSFAGFDGEPVLADKNRAVILDKDSEGCPKLGLHDLNSGGYTVLHSRADDPEINAETEIWQPYVNKDYAVFDIVFFQNMTVKKHEVRAVELATRKWYKVCSPGSWFGVSAIDGNVMYFSISSDVGYTPSVYYRYEIGGGMEPEEVCRGENLTLYNGELYYNTRDYGVDDLGQSTVNYTVYRVGSDQPAVDVEKYGSDFKLGKYGIFGSESGGIVTDCVSGKNILSGGEIDKLSLDLCDFALLVGDDDSGNKAVYDLNTGELLVFEEDDDFYKGGHFREFDGGIYLIKWESGTHSKLYVITEKERPEQQNPVDPQQRYLDKMRKELNVSESVNVAYARDRLNITRFSLPWETAFAIDSGTQFIDSKRAIVSDIVLRNKIEMYMLDTGEYVTLLSAETDPLANENTLYQIYYADSDYIVFERVDFNGQADLCLIELNKDGYPCTTINSNSSENPRMKNLFIDNGTLYYDSLNDVPSVYKYSIGRDEKPVLYIDEGVPLCVYNGELLYYTMEEGEPYHKGVQSDETNYDKRIIHSASGNLSIDGQSFTAKMHACKYGVFEIDGGEFKNCLTKQVIFSADHDLDFFMSMQPDFGVVFGRGFVQYIYNANTNEILVFDSKDNIESFSWKSCKWGVCSDHGILISRFDTGE